MVLSESEHLLSQKGDESHPRQPPGSHDKSGSGEAIRLRRQCSSFSTQGVGCCLIPQMSFVRKPFRKKLAERISRKILGLVAEGKGFERLPGEDMTFTELKDKYLKEHSPKKSPKQFIRGKGIFENHLDPYLEDYLLPDITSDVVSTYKAKRREEGAEPGTINRELTLLKHCFSMACGEWRLLRGNPVKSVRLEKEPKGRVRYLSDQEFSNFHKACADWLKPIVMVAYHTGMRRENILS